MKRRVLSLTLVVFMLVSMCATPILATEINPDFKMLVVGSDATTIGDKTGLRMELRLIAPEIQGLQTLFIAIDSSKLELISAESGKTIAVGNTFEALSKPFNDKAWESVSATADTVRGRNMGNMTLLYFEVNYGTKLTGVFTDPEGIAYFNFALGFKEGVTVNDLDAGSIIIAPVTMPMANSGSEVATVTNDLVAYRYGVISREGGEVKPAEGQDTLDRPTISYPNSNVINLNGVKLTGANKHVNVPVSLPTAGADVKVDLTPAGYYTSDCADGTEIETGVTYTYGLQIKGEGDTAARDLTDEEKAVIYLDENGDLIVKAGAPKAVVTITATGSYTNDTPHTSTAVGTCDVNLHHGDAFSENEKEPEPKPPVGGEPKTEDVTPAASGVAIYENVDGVETQVTIPGSTTPYSKGMAIPAAGAEAKTATFVGKVVDQYGDPMNTETGTWSVTKDSAAYTDTNPTFANGVVTVASGAAKGEYEYKFTSGAYNAAVEINIDDSIITWPTLTTDTIVYGQAVSEFAPTGGSIEPLAEGATAEFVWATNGTEEGAPAIDDDTVLDAGTYTLVMQCKVGETVKGTHNYSVTVGKANQVITIAGDTDEAKRESLAIPRGGDGFDLQTKVTNETVPTATGTSNPTYAIADAETAVMGTETDKLNVITGLKINNDGTKLTITAAANDNYNEATRELTVKVGKELLDAQITLTPADNLIYAQTVTASVKQNTAQPGSLTANTEYKWQRVDNEGTATDINGATGKLVVDSDGNAADITYTAVAADIGYRLRFVVSVGTADKDNTAYEYADMTIATMTNPVGYASWGTFNPAIKTFSPTSITVTGEENAWYAVVKKPETETYAAGDGGASEVTIPNDKWVANNGAGADVVLEEDIDGNNLTPDTLYTVYMKKEAEGYQSEVKTVDQRTAKIEINDENNPASPKGGKVEINGKAFVGETLTAVITDPVLGEGETAETKTVLSTGDIRWYRVTPAADESSEETTEEITGAAGNTTYTVDAADTDKIIRVVVTTKADAAYSGSVQAETAKVVNGHSISGVVTSFNAKKGSTYKLFRKEGDSYKTTADYEDELVAALTETTLDATGQAFTIEGIADGTYKLVISKDQHLDFIVLNLTVNGADVDLTADGMPDRAKEIVLGAGDVDGDNIINNVDQGIIIRSENYFNVNITPENLDSYDINGDGVVNNLDQGIVIRSDHYFKGADTDFTIDLTK